MFCCCPQSPNRKGVKTCLNMFELLLTFFISVLSGIVANYVIKWLERKNDHSNDSKND